MKNFFGNYLSFPVSIKHTVKPKYKYKEDWTITKVSAVELEGETDVINTATYSVKYTPSNAEQIGVIYSIVEGSEYASINAATGILTVLDGADDDEVIIRATSVYNDNVYDELVVSVTKIVYLESLTISGDTEVTDSATYSVTYLPANTTQTGVTWSIVSGSTYATINASTGVLTVLDGASSSTVVIRATSTVDSAITADKTLSVSKAPSGPEWVEIAGIKWAKWNIGATSPTETGLYFQWGDAQGYTASQVGSGEGKKAFSWADYKYSDGGSSASNMTKYNSTDGKTVLDLEDDAVNAAYGGNWRMPTTAELQALGAAVNTAWTSDYQSTGVAGLVCTDKTDSSKVLFFPAAGLCNDGSVNSVGSRGDYWSSSLNAVNVAGARNLNFRSDSANWDSNIVRRYGYPVRGVLAD